MDAQPQFSLARRRVLAAGLGAMTLAAIGSREVSARVILLRGMSGGGLAQLEGSEEPRLANFGLFASSMQLPEGTSLVLGAMQWLEAGTDLQLQSIEITQCIPSDDRARQGYKSGPEHVNDGVDNPVLGWSTDAGRPGSALDRVEIQVNTPTAREGAQGEASDDTFSYEAAGNLVAGDFQWVIADSEV
jgi:hypothetical protein